MAKKKNNINTNHKQTNYSVGDFLIQIKNASMVDQKEINCQHSKLVYEVAKKLKELGFLEKVEKTDGELKISLSYHKKEPVIMNIKIISRPGLRIYKSAQDLGEKKGPSIYILTTNKGILSHNEAIKKNIGGEVIVEIL
jgi:small subunit ribosomal protein S8